MYRFLLDFAVFCLFGLDVLNAITAEEVFAKRVPLTVGIISAVPGESGRLLDLMESPVSKEKGRRTYYTGKLHGIDTVLVASRIGKVAAAATVTHLILEYKVDLVIFTGVAGAIDPSLNVGDVVVATALIQHDMDARPFCPIHEIPLLRIKSCDPDRLLQLFSTQASGKFIKEDLFHNVPPPILNEFHICAPKVVNGLVITGDQVISQEAQKIHLKEKLPDALCVEMEGASVGQVCYEYGIPFTVIRTISDYAQHQDTVIDVKKFVSMAAGYYSMGIINNFYDIMRAHETSVAYDL
jgi:adenosylhomocysteine nucleosidase